MERKKSASKLNKEVNEIKLKTKPQLKEGYELESDAVGGRTQKSC